MTTKYARHYILRTDYGRWVDRFGGLTKDYTQIARLSREDAAEFKYETRGDRDMFTLSSEQVDRRTRKQFVPLTPEQFAGMLASYRTRRRRKEISRLLGEAERAEREARRYRAQADKLIVEDHALAPVEQEAV